MESKEAVEVLREEIPRLKACWDNHHINNFDYKDLYDIGVACEKALLALEENFKLEIMTQDEVKAHIKLCEGKHRQQVAYSSYHDALTQVCFDCKKIRTNGDFK